MTTSPKADGPRAWLLALAVAVLAAWNVREVVDFDFVAFDDDINIYFNARLGPPNRETLAWMWTDTVQMRRYVPLGWLVFSVGYWFSGLSPEGYHTLGVVFHALNAMLVCVVLMRVLARYASHVEPTWRNGVAAAMALLWAWHPMRAETVGWCSGLLYGLSGSFALASVLTYLRAVGSEQRGRWVGATLLLFILSLLTYPLGLGLVGVFVAIDIAEWWRRSGQAGPESSIPWRRWAVEKIVLVIPAVVCAALVWMAATNAHGMWTRPATVADGQAWSRGLRGVAAAGYFLWRPLWPTHLSPSFTEFLRVGPSVIGSWLALAGVAVGLALARPTWRVIGAALLVAYLALLAPLLGWTERFYHPSDRYSYFAMMVLLAAGALGLALIPKRARVVAFATALVLAGIWSVMQRGQLKIWRDTDTLMQRLVETAKADGVRASHHWWWVEYHLRGGRLERAREVLTQAQRYEAPAVLERAATALREAEANPADRRAPRFAKAHQTWAMDFAREGRPIEAEEHFRAARRTAPHFRETAFNLALFLQHQGRVVEAVELYSFHIARAPAEEISNDARKFLLTRLAATFRASGETRWAVAVERERERIK
ncbi:MAG: tetratricopeptide repeat protein [Verrucomicrobiota bacterium]